MHARGPYAPTPRTTVYAPYPTLINVDASIKCPSSAQLATLPVDSLDMDPVVTLDSTAVTFRLPIAADLELELTHDEEGPLIARWRWQGWSWLVQVGDA